MIDELVHHCIHEIGSDGEAGSELDRLHQFIHDFHAQHSNLPRQNVNHVYIAFVLKQLLQHPDVHLGLHIPGIAPAHVRKSNITRKSENNGVATKAESVTAPSLEFDWVQLLPTEQKHLPLQQLQQLHHDKLRLVLTPSLIKRLLLGPNDYGLSTPNYRFLQLVCRAREHAVKSVDLGTIMRYDQKTIFYLAKKLLDLGLIAKIKAPETGTTASYFVATKYMHQCPLLLDQQNADVAADRDARPPTDSALDSHQDLDVEEDADAPTVKVEDAESGTEIEPPQFESVSPEKALLWASSRPELVRLRIYLLCAQTSSKITARIGLTKRIRIEGGSQLKRPMNSLLEHAIIDGYLEVVRVFSSEPPVTDTGYKGLRMTAKGELEMQTLLDGHSADPQEQHMVAEAQKRNAQLSNELAMREPRILREVTLERWLHEEVANAGSLGKSLKQLASSIHACGHVHRMLEGIIQRSEEAVADSSMADLRIRSVHEHNLRIRSTRFFSQHAWVLQSANEGYLQEADRDLLQAAGGVSAVHDHTSCWHTVEALASNVASLASDLYSSQPKTAGVRRGRPPGSTKKRMAEEGSSAPAKRGRPPKKPRVDNATIPIPASSADTILDSAPTGRPDVTTQTSYSDDAPPRNTGEIIQTLGTETNDATGIEDAEAPMSAPNPSHIHDLLRTPVKQEASAFGAVASASKSASTLMTPRSASDRKMKTNLTRLRSAHAIVECIKHAGGAMDSLLIPKQLLAFVEQNGYAADWQLLNFREKRIRDRALSAAIDDGLLRRTYVRLDRPDSHQPKRQIIYLPDLSAQELQKYCDAVLSGQAGWTLDKTNTNTALMQITDRVSLDFSDTVRLNNSKPWHNQEPISIQQLPTEPALLATLRGHFMGVPSVLGQHVGYLGGPMLRLKVFHMACAQLISSEHPSTTMSPPTVPLSYFWTQAPLDLYLALVSIRSPTQAAETTLFDPEMRLRPVQEIKRDLNVALRLTPATMSEVKLVFYSLASQLADLGIVTISTEEADSKSSSVELKRHLPLYDWSADDDEKPLVEVMDAGLSPDLIQMFWAKTQQHCLKRKVSLTTSDTGGSETLQAHDDVVLMKKVPEELKQSMTSIKAWRPFNLLRPSQARFLDRFDLAELHREDVTLYKEALARLAYISLAPVEAIGEFLQGRNRHAAEATVNESGALLKSRNLNQIRWPLKVSVIDVPTDVFVPVPVKVVKPARGKVQSETERDRQGRLTTLKKARELRQRREEQFQGMIEQAFALAPGAEVLRDKIEWALRGIRKRFVGGEARFSNFEEVRKSINRAVGSGAGVKIKMPTVRAASQAATVAPVDTTANPAVKTRQQRSGRRSFVPTNYWNATKNELLRDAVVILRARDRARGRSDWSALLQIVDAADQGKARGFVLAQWRNQYHRMRFLYGEEGYLSALERKWALLSAAARSSGQLVDPSYPSAVDFDLNAQIAFLRTHMDKNEIQSSLAKPATKDPLPLSLSSTSDFTRGWQQEFPSEDSDRKWEVFFSNELGMSARRFEALLGNAFGVETPESTTLSQDRSLSSTQQEEIVRARMAESAVRIVISTEDEQITTGPQHSAASSPVPESAGVDLPSSTNTVMERLKTTFCDSVGSVEIEEAVVRLLENKIIRPLNAEIATRRQPGTNFALTDEFLRILPESASSAQPSSGGGMRLAMNELQRTLRDKVEMLADTSRHWLVEPVETDGDAAALITLMDLDGGVVKTTLDTRPFAALRQHHAFNARILNDDELEALITVQARPDCVNVIKSSSRQVPSIPQEDTVLQWLDEDGASRDLVADWRAEFDLQVANAPAHLPTSSLHRFRDMLLNAGPLGITLRSASTAITYPELVLLLGSSSVSKPLGFLSPTAQTPTLVCSVYVRLYTLQFPSGPSQRRLPHVWSTLTSLSVVMWTSLLDQLVGFIVQRPGTNLAHLATRFCYPSKSDTHASAVVGVSFLDIYQAVRCLLDCSVLELDVLDASVDPMSWILHLCSHASSIWSGFDTEH